MIILVQEWLGKFLVSIGGATEVPSEQPKEEPKPVPTVPPAPVEPVNRGSTQSPDLAYLFATAKIKPEVQGYVGKVCNQFKANQSRYETISKATGVPWQVIACIHQMESTCNWKTHLHNGDSLNARTVHVPAGRPVKGNPPFTFEDSAIDALGYDGATGIKDWNLVATLTFLEKYNGLGYRKHGVYSPYLWSGTQHHSKGKYVADSEWDADAKDDQIGCACFLKVLGYGKS